NSPIRIVIAHRCRNKESPRQLSINLNFLTSIQFFCKCSLNVGVSNDIVINVFLNRDSILTKLTLQCVLREYISMESVIYDIVGNGLNNSCRLLFVNEFSGPYDELLRVLLIQHECSLLDPLQYSNYGLSCELGFVH